MIKCFLMKNNIKTKATAPMQITTLRDNLKAMFNPQYLLAIARKAGFIRRLRSLNPLHLTLAIVQTLSDQRSANLTDIYRALMKISGTGMKYKPFHNQLKKSTLVKLMQTLVEQAIYQWISKPFQQTLSEKYPFKQVHIHDGSSVTLHPALASVFAGRFTKTAPAAIELHVTVDLLTGAPNFIGIDADKESERLYQPYAHELRDTLVMMDAGYFDLGYCHDIDKSDGYYIVRAKKNINPASCIIRDSLGRPVIGLHKGELRNLGIQPGEFRDLTIQWKTRTGVYRLIAFWDRRNRCPGYLITNLPQKDFSAQKICDLYALRWQVELFFKELKSFCNLKTFITRDKHIVQTLIWGSMLAVLLKRCIAFSTGLIYGSCISTQKVARSSVLWMQTLLTALLNPQHLTESLKEIVDFINEYAGRSHLKRDRETSLFSLGLAIYSGYDLVE